MNNLHKNIYIILLFTMIVVSNSYTLSEGLEFENIANQSHFNGKATESFMHSHFRKSGWTQLPGEVGSNGFDGLYIKKDAKGNIRQVLISESKYNKATLGTTKNGKVAQMSTQWCKDKIDDLIKHGDPKYRKDYLAIQKHIENGSYRRRLFKLIPNGVGKYTVHLKEIISDGLKGIKISKLTGNLKYQIDGKKINIKNTKNSHSQMLRDAQKGEKKSFLKQGKAQKIMAKTVRKSSVYTMMSKIGKSGVLPAMKSMGKVGLIFAKGLPFVGVVAQAAWDMQVSNDIENNKKGIADNSNRINQNSSEISKNREDMKQNTNEIYYNRALIQRLEEEYSIIGDAVKVNQAQMHQITKQLLQVDGRMVDMANEISLVASNLSVVAEIVEENAKEIEKLKNNFFITGAEDLQNFYNTGNHTSLSNAVNNFHLYKNISDRKIKALAMQYYIIALSEDHQVQSNINALDFKRKENSKIISNEFNKLMKIVPSTYVFLPIVINSYISVLDVLSENEIEALKPKIEKFYKKVVAKLIKEHRFDTAVFAGSNYSKLMHDVSLEEKAKIAREKNFQEQKIKMTVANAEKIVNKYENTLLNEVAIRKLDRADNKLAALNLLQRKFIADQTFHYSAYLNLYYELGEDEKYKKLKDLINKNNTYPEELRLKVKEIY